MNFYTCTHAHNHDPDQDVEHFHHPGKLPSCPFPVNTKALSPPELTYSDFCHYKFTLLVLEFHLSEFM